VSVRKPIPLRRSDPSSNTFSVLSGKVKGSAGGGIGMGGVAARP